MLWLRSGAITMTIFYDLCFLIGIISLVGSEKENLTQHARQINQSGLLLAKASRNDQLLVIFQFSVNRKLVWMLLRPTQ